MASATAESLGPYELVHRLGVGGMAETFLAIRRGPNRFEQHVCLKRILPAYASDPEFVRLFMREARVSGCLRHGNIAQVLDFGVADGHYYLVLELIEGMDLRELLRALARNEKQLDAALVSHLAFEIGRALDFAHAADEEGRVSGVIHRDISTSNVLLSRAGEIKLSDFGIAKAMNQTHVSHSRSIKGKIPYMAPEYARHGICDARSDLFSLGVTLYECLAGCRPYSGTSEVEILKKAMHGDHPPLAKAAPHTPPALAAIIERLLEPEPDQRYANASRFLDALDDVAPPLAARRELGTLVRKYSAPVSMPSVQYDDTLHVSPGGTIVLDDGDNTTADHIAPAGPDEDTRTRN